MIKEFEQSLLVLHAFLYISQLPLQLGWNHVTSFRLWTVSGNVTSGSRDLRTDVSPLFFSSSAVTLESACPRWRHNKMTEPSLYPCYPIMDMLDLMC